MSEVILIGRVVDAEHNSPATPKRSSKLTVSVEKPYPHLAIIEMPWMPMIYPHHPGDDFAEKLRDAGTVIIRAKVEDERLTASRSDIFVNAREWR